MDAATRHERAEGERGVGKELGDGAAVVDVGDRRRQKRGHREDFDLGRRFSGPSGIVLVTSMRERRER